MTSREAVRLWDAEAPAFDLAADHGLLDKNVRAAWSRLMHDLLPPPASRVADLGCGTGTLALLLAEQGHSVDGIDFSPEMVARALTKTAHEPGVSVTEADAYDPPLTPGDYDVVLSRHVLWAMPDPVEALRRWSALLGPEGRLVLVEGHWSQGDGTRGGLTAQEVVEALRSIGRTGTVHPLPDPHLWGKRIDDERYAVVSLAP
ncbi:SAM-dependent methyltransferase [Nocardioides marinisabuli]|uniref:SAM-dependent methyltransferase n=1 Tax=Nocardioides marinisabuli TaxID=419476 RepID=A0A7Y9JPK0_9ACTN|nr:class I SAM-dependent methyltransferase [Nocardioides marinisabuli]NYD56455.1 SAM-dependent methyltransferase [Nocardioides marinisabuli]